MTRHQHERVRRFERMSRLKNYTVEKGVADPRGWKVIDGSDQVAGRVTDLVIDTDRMTAAYLEVELDRRMFGIHDEPRILVPIRRAERDGTARRLVLPELTRSRVTALFDARADHEADFWERWWTDAEQPHDRAVAAQHTAHHADQVPPDAELGRAISQMRPGEELRIPIGTEQLVVERRRIEPRETITAREADETSRPPSSTHEYRYRPPLGRPDEVRDVNGPRSRSRLDE